MIRGLLLGALALLLSIGTARAQEYPIADTHLHYSFDAWPQFSVDEILELMEQAGIKRAFVSSTPDDGTLMLYQRAPGLVVPVLRPYRTRDDNSGWTHDDSIVGYVEGRLSTSVPYRGIGEFHLYRGQAQLPVPVAIGRMAAARGLFLHSHSDDVAISELAAVNPDVTILWAHAGISSSAAEVGRVLDSYANVLVELALRSDVAYGGRLDPAWEALFIRHADRVMVGTDTWTPSQWPRVPRLMAAVQTWLAQLPPDVAEKIAFRNSDRLLAGR